jgi:hypothetical protein
VAAAICAFRFLRGKKKATKLVALVCPALKEHNCAFFCENDAAHNLSAGSHSRSLIQVKIHSPDDGSSKTAKPSAAPRRLTAFDLFVGDIGARACANKNILWGKFRRARSVVAAQSAGG